MAHSFSSIGHRVRTPSVNSGKLSAFGCASACSTSSRGSGERQYRPLSSPPSFSPTIPAPREHDSTLRYPSTTPIISTTTIQQRDQEILMSSKDLETHLAMAPSLCHIVIFSPLSSAVATNFFVYSRTIASKLSGSTILLPCFFLPSTSDASHACQALSHLPSKALSWLSVLFIISTRPLSRTFSAFLPRSTSRFSRLSHTT